MKRFLLGLAVVALLVPPTPASAWIRSVKFENNSSNCVWLTFYRKDAGWVAYGDSNKRPRFIPAGQSFTIDTATDVLRVRAEIMNNGGCHSGEIGVLEIDRTTRQYEEHVIAALTGNTVNKFHLRWTK
jgi:hypothetical protein